MKTTDWFEKYKKERSNVDKLIRKLDGLGVRVGDEFTGMGEFKVNVVSTLDGAEKVLLIDS